MENTNECNIQIKAQKISDERAEAIEQLPLLDSLLPYEFGATTIDNIAVTCAGCEQELGQNTIRGELIPGPYNCRLEAYGICYSCHTITPISGRFGADGTVMFKSKNGWSESELIKPEPEMPAWQKGLPPAAALVVIALWWITR